MTNTGQQTLSSDGTDREFVYTSDSPLHTHAYLWPIVLDLLPRDGGRVLDAGCGNGAFAKVLADQGKDVCGVDLSQTGIEHARRACPAGTFAVASVTEDLRPLFREPFDVIVALEVIEHLYDPHAFATNVRTLLRPGGTLIVSTPYHGYLKNLALAVSGKMDSHFTALWPGGHIKFWSVRTLSSLLESAGFRVEQFRGAGRVSYMWKSMVLTARPVA